MEVSQKVNHGHETDVDFVSVTDKMHRLAEAYITAKESIIEKGYADEIDWQYNLSFDDMTECDFLREAAWVILSSGMKERVIRNVFPSISNAFLRWSSSEDIFKQKRQCVSKALKCFGSRPKIEAIAHIAMVVAKEGFSSVKKEISVGSVNYLQQFPFLGPATAYHLAKNIGLQVVKPDRHLVRVAIQAGFDSPNEMCAELARVTGERLSVVDIVIWRYATIDRQYLTLFKY